MCFCLKKTIPNQRYFAKRDSNTAFCQKRRIKAPIACAHDETEPYVCRAILSKETQVAYFLPKRDESEPCVWPKEMNQGHRSSCSLFRMHIMQQSPTCVGLFCEKSPTFVGLFCKQKTQTAYFVSLATGAGVLPAPSFAYT